MATGPRYTSIVAGLPASVPFVGPETQERQSGRAFKARLGANESGFGPSPQVLGALRDAAGDVWMYGDPENHDLRMALAAHHGLGIENITVGEGIDGLLGTLVRLLIAPGDPVVTSAGAYPTFAYHVKAADGAITQVPYKGDFEDPDALVAAAHETQAKLVYLANPDNPMGSWHSAEAIEKMLADLPKDCLLVLDEAYADLAPASALPAIDPTDTRVIRMRTFSKAHGLAGMRVGYAIAQADLITAFNKIRNHFGVGRLSQIAALAALRDSNYLSEVQAKVAKARDQIAGIARQNGLTPLPSATNFVTIDCGQDGDFARAVLQNLIKQGIFVRMPFVAPQDRCIRVSVGPQAEIDAFAKALPHALLITR